MDAQDTVLDHYPDAQAIEEPPILLHGEASPIQRGCWDIYAGNDLDAGPLGSGRTEAKAWGDAARKLKTHEAA